MRTERRTAILVGILFICATGFFMLGQMVYAPLLRSPEYLDLIHASPSRFVGGLLLELVGVLAIPLIAVFFFPILRRQDEGLALSYVALRVLETVPFLVVGGSTIALLSIGDGYQMAAVGEAQTWGLVGDAMKSINESTFTISVGIVFPIGALIVYSMLYRSRLVPRVISGWGFLGAALLLGGSVLDLFGVLDGFSATLVEAVLAGPIAIQEMVFAVWLIVKGFDAERLSQLGAGTAQGGMISN